MSRSSRTFSWANGSAWLDPDAVREVGRIRTPYPLGGFVSVFAYKFLQLSGRVVDAGGATVPNAQVRFESSNPLTDCCWRRVWVLRRSPQAPWISPTPKRRSSRPGSTTCSKWTASGPS